MMSSASPPPSPSPHGASSGGGKKKKRKKKAAAEEEQSHRFEVELNADRDDAKNKKDDGSYNVNWLDLLADEQDRKVGNGVEGESGPLAGLDPYASDDEDQMRALAMKFEAKYGGGGGEDIRKKKKKRKIDDYADLGYGYDSNDSFIDNGDVHDEIVPENVTTALGGFYINAGALEYRVRESADEDSDVEAILQEGEKAAKKRKYKKKEEYEEMEEQRSKKFKNGNGMSSVDRTIADVVGEVPKKPRIRKDGARPLGRPKMRNPDGSLVHPPKLPKVKKPVLLSGSPAGSSSGLTITPTSSAQHDQKQKPHLIPLKKKKRQVMMVSTPGSRKTATESADSVTVVNSGSLTIQKRPKVQTTTVVTNKAKPESSSSAATAPSTATTHSVTKSLTSSVSVTMTKVRETPVASSSAEKGKSNGGTSSSSSDEAVKDAQVRMLESTVESMLKGIPTPDKTTPASTPSSASSSKSKILAGGATITPASSSPAVSAANKSVQKSGGGGGVQQQAKSQKGMTVKQQLDEVRKKNQNSPSASPSPSSTRGSAAATTASGTSTSSSKTFPHPGSLKTMDPLHIPKEDLTSLISHYMGEGGPSAEMVQKYLKMGESAQKTVSAAKKSKAAAKTSPGNAKFSQVPGTSKTTTTPAASPGGTATTPQHQQQKQQQSHKQQQQKVQQPSLSKKTSAPSTSTPSSLSTTPKTKKSASSNPSPQMSTSSQSSAAAAAAGNRGSIVAADSLSHS